MRLDAASVASLILSALVADDAATARELGAVTGLSTARLRPALRLLLDHGSVVTSGRGAGTRYVLTVVETTRPARVRRARPTIPATVDVMGALEQTAARLAAGATLSELSARSAPARIVIAEIATEVGTLARSLSRPPRPPDPRCAASAPPRPRRSSRAAWRSRSATRGSLARTSRSRAASACSRPCWLSRAC